MYFGYIFYITFVITYYTSDQLYNSVFVMRLQIYYNVFQFSVGYCLLTAYISDDYVYMTILRQKLR